MIVRFKNGSGYNDGVFTQCTGHPGALAHTHAEVKLTLPCQLLGLLAEVVHSQNDLVSLE